MFHLSNIPFKKLRNYYLFQNLKHECSKDKLNMSLKTFTKYMKLFLYTLIKWQNFDNNELIVHFPAPENIIKNINR